MNILNDEDTKETFVIFMSDKIIDIREVLTEEKGLKKIILDSIEKKHYLHRNTAIDDTFKELAARKTISIPDSKHKFIIISMEEK